MARAEFTDATKKALAERAGFRCCFPTCDRTTLGPSAETDSSVSRTGMAAHIIAASTGPGARRADPTKTDEELSSIDNGIWMCYFHGKIVDTDETTYTIPMLKKWRASAEEIQRIRHAIGKEVDFLGKHDSEARLLILR